MTVFNHANMSRGRHVQADVRGMDVIKTSKMQMEKHKAEQYARLLEGYVDELDREPIPVAPVRDIKIKEVDGRAGLWVVLHTMRLVDGPNINEQSREVYRNSISAVIGYVCAMSTMANEPDILNTPVDVSTRNIHMANVDGRLIPVAVDLYPPLSRNGQGEIEAFQFQTARNRRDAEESLGRKSHIASDLLFASAPALSEADFKDWCMDTVPQYVAPGLRQLISRQLDCDMLVLFPS